MNNKELFELLYDVLFEYDPDFIEVSRKTDSMISEIMESVSEVSEQEEEAISDAFMNILSEARRDSYMIGVKHAVKLLFSLLHS